MNSCKPGNFDAGCDAGTKSGTCNATDTESAGRGDASISDASNARTADDGAVLPGSTSEWKYN